MSFNSFNFLAFIAIVFPLYCALSFRWQNRMLLLASYIFYGFWNWSYLPLLIGISLFAGLVAQRIQRSQTRVEAKRWLIVGAVVCLAALGYYKYTGFLTMTLLQAWGRFAPPPRIPIHSPLLPLGISFFVFHAISLLGDCYRGKLREPVKLGDALEEWTHKGTQGRDNYVRVVYKGYLFPFGHPASLIKITERKFYVQNGRNIAYLFQRMFIVVREPIKQFGASKLVDSAGRSIDRAMPFKQIQITTITTPDIMFSHADQPTRPVMRISGPSIRPQPK